MIIEISLCLAFISGLASLSYAYFRTIDKAIAQLDEQRKSTEALIHDAFTHLAARNAKEAAEAKALEEHEREVIRQSKEAFDVQRQEVQKEQPVLRDVHGNEYEIIGGEV